MLPTTVKPRTSGCNRAEIVDGTPEQVLAQVEETCPERGAVGRCLEPGRGGEPLEGTHEDGELEVGLCDPHRRRVHAGTREDRLPFDELGGAPPQRRLALARCRGRGIAPRPSLEKAAERERGRLACAELDDEPATGHVLDPMLLEHVCPAGYVPGRAPIAHTTPSARPSGEDASI